MFTSDLVISQYHQTGLSGVSMPHPCKTFQKYSAFEFCWSTFHLLDTSVSVEQDKSQAKDIASAHELQVKEEEPPNGIESTEWVQSKSRYAMMSDDINSSTKGTPTPVDVSSSSKEIDTLNSNSGATAEHSTPKSIQESLHPQDNERPEITASYAVDPHKSTVGSPRNAGAGYIIPPKNNHIWKIYLIFSGPVSILRTIAIQQ